MNATCLSGVSHELRSPIARIRLALTLAREADATERQEMLDRIEQDTIQLDSMLEQILTVARLESGQLKPKFESAFAERAGRRRAPTMPGSKRQPRTPPSPALPSSNNIQVTGDPGLLRSAIENVVRNAIFYSGEGGKIAVELTQTDNGGGACRDGARQWPRRASEENCSLSSSRFIVWTIPAAATTGGMGLGLAIANNAVVSHGGGIIARNVEPHGLEIQLMIPASPHPPEAGQTYGPFVMQTTATTRG